MTSRCLTSILGSILLVASATMAPAATQDIKLGASCVTAECHGDLKEPAHLHGPVNLNQCEPCHIAVENRHEFKAAEVGPGLCRTCHDAEAAKPVVHGPFQSDCTLCHDPHGGDNVSFVKGGQGAGSCNLCHDSVTEGKSHLHGPVAMGECLVCHTPHQSDHKGLLIEPRRDLCLGCHVDVGVAMENSLSVHQPVEETCSGCHDPHGGTTQFFLPSEGSELCMSCHTDFIETALKAAFPHGAMTEGKACRNCHAPHASSQQGLLSTATKDLCLSCHDKEITRGERVIKNVAGELEVSSFQHGPIRENNCVACHQAHGSEEKSILTKSFPKEFYAPYKEGAYDLCFECHDRTSVEQEKSQATSFRDGDRNLHFVHVNREKGRTCRACHAEHASNQAHHVRSEVPFGRWSMKIKFEKSETGGTCETGCHVPYRYDRVTPAIPPK